MTKMRTSVIPIPSPISAVKAAAVRYLSCLRLREILVLQGSPLLGAAFAIRHPAAESVGPLAMLAVANVCLMALLFSRLGPSTLGLSLAIASLSALYSLPRFHWKGRPLLSSAAHLAGGALHFLLGYSVGSAIDRRGFATAT